MSFLGPVSVVHLFKCLYVAVHGMHNRARGMSSQLVRPKLHHEDYAIKCVGGRKLHEY